MLCASVGSGSYNKTLVGRDTRKNTRRNSMFRAKALCQKVYLVVGVGNIIQAIILVNIKATNKPQSDGFRETKCKCVLAYYPPLWH